MCSEKRSLLFYRSNRTIRLASQTGYQPNCKERLLAGKEKIIREATEPGASSTASDDELIASLLERESNSNVTNNDRLLRWCYSNRLIRQNPYFNYFRITDIEKSEHNYNDERCLADFRVVYPSYQAMLKTNKEGLILISTVVPCSVFAL